MTIRNLHLNIAIGLNSFIVFFLLFEGQIVLPPSLQVIGRMHPLLLHFPIVLIAITWFLVCFGNKFALIIPGLQLLVAPLVFISSIFTASTVILGLLLSKEGGYVGNDFLWHKWSGVTLSFLSFALLTYEYRRLYVKWRPILVVGVNFSLFLLLIAGHYGGILTHGENYVLAPLVTGSGAQLDLERGLVFEDALYPIIQTRCLGCHNDSKPKGGLNLVDSASMLRGGKNGQLFVAGASKQGLLLERLLLDIDHEHHMPPKGKPQLSEEELALVNAWISHGAKFNYPIAALADQDTLMQAIKAAYAIRDIERYDFGPAKTGELEKLSNPYRRINLLAEASPALAVNFYGRDFFTGTSLSELASIATQIVSLNLSGMPVSKSDLEILKSFVNLRELNLNYTPLDDSFVARLGVLPKIKRIGLSGTRLTQEGLRKVLEWPQLQKVFVWNTLVNETQLQQIGKQFPGKVIEVGYKDDVSVRMPLTVPDIKPSRSFFRDGLEISISHPIQGVDIRYTLDGSEPDSLNSPVYKKPIKIGQNGTLRVKAYKDGWLASEVVERNYQRAPKVPDSVMLGNKPHHLYRAQQATTLFDLESGGSNHADGKWMGYHDSDLSAELFFDKPTSIDTLIFSVMQRYNQVSYMYIYPPEYIEIWGGIDSLNTNMLFRKMPSLEKPGGESLHRLIQCRLSVKDIRYIKLVVKPYRRIPDGYPAAGLSAWLFLDEIIIK